MEKFIRMGNIIKMALVLLVLLAADKAEQGALYVVGEIKPRPVEPCKKWHLERYASVGGILMDKEVFVFFQRLILTGLMLCAGGCWVVLRYESAVPLVMSCFLILGAWFFQDIFVLSRDGEIVMDLSLVKRLGERKQGTKIDK